MNFDAFVSDIRDNRLEVYGAEVWQDGILTDRYGDTEQTRYPIYSATKTVTSIAAGLALDEGKLSLEDSILRYLPEEVWKGLPEQQVRTLKLLTLKRLMTMSVQGYPFRPWGESWLRNALSFPLENPQEPRFDYSNIPAYLTGATITHAVGEDLYAYLNRKLFVPLGINNPPCGRCPDGYFYGASQMALTVNELSRIGLLLLNGGVYREQRILSEAYVREATSLQQKNRDGGYGYFLWKYRDGCCISGKWKQKCCILPSQKKVITFLSHIEDSCPILAESMERNLI